MTYAIIETGGKQLRVEAGRFYDIELLAIEPEQTVTLETVLLVQHNGDVTIGQPFIEGATVEGTVMRHFRGRKVIVYKMKPKKKTRKKRGHRQEITRLMIDSISLNGSTLTSEAGAIDETSSFTATSITEQVPEEVTAEVVPETLLQSFEPPLPPSELSATEPATEAVADELATEVTDNAVESEVEAQ